MTCQLCGLRYEGEQAACSACPLGESGYLSCCPRCGYHNIGKSKLIGFFERILEGITKWKRR